MTKKNKQKITVTAKCPKCKKTKQFVNDKPINYTPHCDKCFVPLFIHKLEIAN